MFEFEDQPWFPATIREGGTDYLRFFLNNTKFYKPIVPVLAEIQELSGVYQLTDLCSGGGGGIEQVTKDLKEIHPGTRVLLTDKFPNIPGFKYLEKNMHGTICFHPLPVDAKNVPGELTGIRTMFSATHHFKPEQIKMILTDTVRKKQPIAMFDGGNRNLLVIAGMLVIHPLLFLLFTPFFRPFKISRIFFTYLLPLIPAMTIWDGVVSILRLYSPAQMLAIAQSVPDSNYSWKAGLKKNRLGFSICYLTGLPPTG